MIDKDKILSLAKIVTFSFYIDQMTELFQRNKSTISRYIRNVFEEGG